MTPRYNLQLLDRIYLYLLFTLVALLLLYAATAPECRCALGKHYGMNAVAPEDCAFHGAME